MIDRQMAFQYAMVKNRAKNKENTGYVKGIDEGERLQEFLMLSIIKASSFVASLLRIARSCAIIKREVARQARLAEASAKRAMKEMNER